MRKQIIIEALENLVQEKSRELRKKESKIYNQSIEITFLLGFIKQSESRDLFIQALEDADPDNGYIDKKSIKRWLNYLEDETQSLID